MTLENVIFDAGEFLPCVGIQIILKQGLVCAREEVWQYALLVRGRRSLPEKQWIAERVFLAAFVVLQSCRYTSIPLETLYCIGFRRTLHERISSLLSYRSTLHVWM